MTSFTPILHAPQVAPGQNQKEATINTAMAIFEAAGNDQQTISLAAGGHTLTTDEFTKYFHTLFNGHTVARTVVVPNTKRVFAVYNGGTANVTVQSPTPGSTVVVPASTRALLMSDGVNVVALTNSVSQAVTFDFFTVGLPTASQRVLRKSIVQALTFAADFGGSQGHADTAATANADFQVLKNGTLVGTIHFAAASNTPTFSTNVGSGSVAVTFAAGDILTIVAPASADATLADLNATLKAALV
jgi:hypothetical protein